MAAALWAWCRGRSDEDVAEKGPPKTLSVQISLTPVPLAMHPSQGAEVSAAGGKAGGLAGLHQRTRPWQILRKRA